MKHLELIEYLLVEVISFLKHLRFYSKPFKFQPLSVYRSLQYRFITHISSYLGKNYLGI